MHVPSLTYDTLDISKGATLNQLSADLNVLKQEIVTRRRDVGFTGKSVDVVKHAIKILGPKLVKSEVRPMNPDVVPFSQGERNQLRNQRDLIVPNTSLPDVLELSYYANAVLSVFVMESVVGELLDSRLF